MSINGSDVGRGRLIDDADEHGDMDGGETVIAAATTMLWECGNEWRCVQSYKIVL